MKAIEIQHIYRESQNLNREQKNYTQKQNFESQFVPDIGYGHNQGEQKDGIKGDISSIDEMRFAVQAGGIFDRDSFPLSHNILSDSIIAKSRDCLITAGSQDLGAHRCGSQPENKGGDKKYQEPEKKPSSERERFPT